MLEYIEKNHLHQDNCGHRNGSYGEKGTKLYTRGLYVSIYLCTYVYTHMHPAIHARDPALNARAGFSACLMTCFEAWRARAGTSGSQLRVRRATWKECERRTPPCGSWLLAALAVDLPPAARHLSYPSRLLPNTVP